VTLFWTAVNWAGFSGGALKHGPFALIEGANGREGQTPVICLILDDDHASTMRTAAEEVKARGAKLFVITDNVKLATGLDSDPIVIPSNGPLTALIAVLPLQVCEAIIELIASGYSYVICAVNRLRVECAARDQP
jgi:glucosamine--fructose-6-phosphate aminotransferase (isomerizing)